MTSSLMNGETDDEDVEDGETGYGDGSAQVRNLRDPRTQRAHNLTSTLQIMVKVLRDGTWCEFAAKEIGCKMIWKGCSMCR